MGWVGLSADDIPERRLGIEPRPKEPRRGLFAPFSPAQKLPKSLCQKILFLWIIWGEKFTFSRFESNILKMSPFFFWKVKIRT